MKTIKHSSFVTFYQKDKDFYNRFLQCRTLKDVMKFIDVEYKKYDTLYKDCFENAECIKGDIFEIFAEGFFHVLEGAPQIGICGYKPAPKNDDNGVDGFGTGMDEKPATVQVKFRTNPVYELTERDLHQFAFQSIMVYDVEKTTNKNMIVFTSAKGIHWYTASNVFKGSLRAIAGDDIRRNVDNNICFWKALEELINDSKEKYFGTV